MRAHWRHLANTIEPVLPSAHPSPQSKRQINPFSLSCTAHGRKSLYLQWTLLPPKLPLAMGDLDPHLIYGSMGPSESSTQMVSWSFQPFLHRRPQSVPILYNGTPLPLLIAPSHGGSGPQSNTWFPGPTLVLSPNGISISSAVFAGLTSVTDQQTTLLGR